MMPQAAEPPASLFFPAAKPGTVKGVMLLPWTPGQDPLSELKHQSSADRGRPGLSCLTTEEVLSQGEDLEKPAAKCWQTDLVVGISCCYCPSEHSWSLLQPGAEHFHLSSLTIKKKESKSPQRVCG